jgi:23S rRNA (uracil1939-C5)-methyltransferase
LVQKSSREYRAVTGDTGSVLEPTDTARSRRVSRQVGEDFFTYSAECFFQANVPVAAALQEEVLRIADEASGSDGIALDLYCGVGLFTVPLARKFRRVVGVESFKAAADFAEENLKHAGLKNGRLVTAPVEFWIAGDRSPIGRIALAVFDPPRQGAGIATIEHLVKLKPAHVAAVSCDPATFARDIRGLIDGGYEVVSIKGFDMFPQTHHVEIVAHLRRLETV